MAASLPREETDRPAPKFKVGDIVVERLTIETIDSDFETFEVTEVRWEWESSIWRCQLNFSFFVSEDNLRPAPKFKVGDIVLDRVDLFTDFDVNNRFKITQIYWGNRHKWLYQLNDEYGRPTASTTERHLRIAPKFKVGDEVFLVDQKYEVTEVHWLVSDDTEGLWEYKLRRNDGTETGWIVEDNMSPAPENRNKRKRDSKEVQKQKKILKF